MATPVVNLVQKNAEVSPFLNPGLRSTASSLAVLHLRRDSLVPTILEDVDVNDEGYAEGKVTNTRFGSFPHSTLIGLPWGSQVAASVVDTGSRGRRIRDAAAKKRKIDEVDDNDETTNITDSGPRAKKAQKPAVAAASGFCHLLPPTPESWTLSLPHRTQVVYTPDYSFILQKLCVRPGSVVIEAGAGSGSFTHAAARAVFSGTDSEPSPNSSRPKLPRGQVYSFEYHAPRAQQLATELATHGLTPFVHLTHRDVYRNGFLLPPPATNTASSDAPVSPNATHIFLDLPQPWKALPHLTRSPTTASPLNPLATTRLALFLPCIEQVARATTALRTHGWTELSVHEVAQRRVDVRRERVGLAYEGLRGVRAAARDVEECVGRLREVEGRWRERGERQRQHQQQQQQQQQRPEWQQRQRGETGTRAERLEGVRRAAEERSGLCDGRLVVRTETEAKTHTSYLVFAVLPVIWSEEEERRCRERWPVKVVGAVDGDGDGNGDQDAKAAAKGTPGKGKKARLKAAAGNV